MTDDTILPPTFRERTDPVANHESVATEQCILCSGVIARHKAERISATENVLDVPTKRHIHNHNGAGFVHLKCLTKYKRHYRLPSGDDQ